MAGVANPNHIELIVRTEVFHRLVQPVYDNDELGWYGLEPRGLLGDLGPSQLATLIQVCEQQLEFHIVSCCKNLRTINRLVTDAAIFYLARGDKNPYLVFNPWVDPMASLLDEDVFGKLGCEPHEIYRKVGQYSNHTVGRVCA
ncbi:MAG: hypothetical protein NTY08_09055 [Proteobacteria bacterium]|nr:hypothetical protein [Pseudomonadota bacterium]